jgi:hypothetical protein
MIPLYQSLPLWASAVPGFPLGTKGELHGTKHSKAAYPRPGADFSDWCAKVRELAGQRWPDVADQCATLYALWGGGATPAQALHMVNLILPPQAAEAA